MHRVRYGLTALIFTAAIAPLSAQSSDNATPSPNKPASAPSVTATPTAQQGTPPFAGANSFTETQAVERIQKSGFTGIQNLKQDEKGIWRGDASKNGQPVKVSLDFRGNVTQQ